VSRRLQRVAAFFVSPPDQALSRRAEIPPAARIVVLGATGEVAPVAAATALGLRGAGTPGLVALWRGDHEPRPGVATRAALRLAAMLTARGLPAVSRGRLAWLALPDDPEAAATAVRRASALVAGPFVTGLAGPRPPELELLIAEHDIAVVIAQPDSPLARAALASLADRGIPATATAPLQRGAARPLALAGIHAQRWAATEVVGAGAWLVEPAMAPRSEGGENAPGPSPETGAARPPDAVTRRRNESIWSDP
jgi:hypothetical protein